MLIWPKTEIHYIKKIDEKQIPNLWSALKFLARYSSQSQNSNFLQKSHKGILWNNWKPKRKKNPSTDKFTQPLYILSFFCLFLGQKWIEKGPDLIFLECWDSELMSLMIWQKNIFFSFQNVVKIVIFLFWGLFSLYSSPWVPRGAGGGVSHLILPF